MALWNSWDWKWRRKLGTLTTVADAATVDVPADFAELDQRFLRDLSETSSPLRFTEDITFYQAFADGYETTETGEPRVAVIVRDPDEATWDMHFLMSPIPNAVYVYAYWYLVRDPWSSAALADTAAPVWPVMFDEGWRMLAKAKVLESFEQGDRWKDAMVSFSDWRKQAQAENDETITTGGSEFIQDGYGDIDAMLSRAVKR